MSLYRTRKYAHTRPKYSGNSDLYGQGGQLYSVQAQFSILAITFNPYVRAYNISLESSFQAPSIPIKIGLKLWTKKYRIGLEGTKMIFSWAKSDEINILIENNNFWD